MIDLPDSATPRLRQAVVLAEQTARRDNRPVSPEHLLLGLLAEGTGDASAVLRRPGIDPSALDAMLSAQMDQAPLPGPSLPGRMSPGQASVALAENEAAERGHHYLGQGHLLLGLLREPDSPVAEVLARFGVTYDRVVAEFNTMFS